MHDKDRETENTLLLLGRLLRRLRNRLLLLRRLLGLLLLLRLRGLVIRSVL